MDLLSARHTIRLDAERRVAGTVSDGNAHFGGIIATKAHLGFLRLTDAFEVAAYTKPNALHRWAMRLVFGWKWRDA